MFEGRRLFNLTAIRGFLNCLSFSRLHVITRAAKLELPLVKKKENILLSVMEDTSEPKRQKCSGSSSSDELSETAQEANTRSSLREKLKETVTSKRQWRYTKYGKNYLRGNIRDEGLDFTVMSYNVLSQELLEGHLYLYTHCRPEDLKWMYRFENIMNEISNHSPDVICLQEVQATHFKDCFQPCMEKIGYRSIYKKKTGSKCDGCAIFFKGDIFKLEYCSGVEYFKAGTATLDRDNIGLIAVLRPQTEKLSNIKLCIATTHLLFNPRRGDIKLSQIRVLLAELDKLAFRSSVNGMRTYYPVVLCGDMNAEPFSPLYNFICCGKINFEGMIAGDISGQEEGRNKGRLLTTDLLDLTNVGINSETLYVEGQKSSSFGTATSNFSVEGCSESCSSSVVNCSDSSATLSLSKGSGESGSGTESGCVAFYGLPTGDAFAHKPKKCYLSHPFNFDTSYRHFRSAKAWEVTTHNRKSMCTVDYIFYNLKHKRCLKIGGQCTTHVNKAEGELKLVGSYGLLYPGDFRDIGGLPNACLSSDHLCLISRFFLSL